MQDIASWHAQPKIVNDGPRPPGDRRRASRCRAAARIRLDLYFRAARARRGACAQDGGAARGSEPWLELADAAGEPYWCCSRAHRATRGALRRAVRASAA